MDKVLRFIPPIVFSSTKNVCLFEHTCRLSTPTLPFTMASATTVMPPTSAGQIDLTSASIRPNIVQSISPAPHLSGKASASIPVMPAYAYATGSDHAFLATDMGNVRFVPAPYGQAQIGGFSNGTVQQHYAAAIDQLRVEYSKNPEYTFMKVRLRYRFAFRVARRFVAASLALLPSSLTLVLLLLSPLSCLFASWILGSMVLTRVLGRRLVGWCGLCGVQYANKRNQAERANFVSRGLGTLVGRPAVPNRGDMRVKVKDAKMMFDAGFFNTPRV